MLSAVHEHGGPEYQGLQIMLLTEETGITHGEEYNTK